MERCRRRAIGTLACAAGAAACVCAHAASAQNPPQNLQMEIRGAGVVAGPGVETQVTTVIYATSGETKRTTFSVILPDRTVTFSGVQEAWSDATHDVLSLDAVLVLAREGVKDLQAKGECRMEISADATFVRSVDCTASTAAGDFSLKFALRGAGVRPQPGATPGAS